MIYQTSNDRAFHSFTLTPIEPPISDAVVDTGQNPYTAREDLKAWLALSGTSEKAAGTIAQLVEELHQDIKRKIASGDLDAIDLTLNLEPRAETYNTGETPMLSCRVSFAGDNASALSSDLKLLKSITAVKALALDQTISVHFKSRDAAPHWAVAQINRKRSAQIREMFIDDLDEDLEEPSQE